MPYYVRSFCIDASRPTIDKLEEVLKLDNPSIRFNTDDDRMSPNWSQAEFFYKEGKSPVKRESHL